MVEPVASVETGSDAEVRSRTLFIWGVRLWEPVACDRIPKKSPKALDLDEVSTSVLLRSCSKVVLVLSFAEVTSCMGCSFGQRLYKSRSK